MNAYPDVFQRFLTSICYQLVSLVVVSLGQGRLSLSRAKSRNVGTRSQRKELELASQNFPPFLNITMVAGPEPTHYSPFNFRKREQAISDR